jgi:hypothetical protein
LTDAGKISKMISQIKRGEKIKEASKSVQHGSSRNMSMDSSSVAMFSSYGDKDCVQEVSISPVWRFTTEQSVNPNGYVVKEKVTPRYNFSSFLAKNRLKAGKLMKAKAQGASNMIEMRQRFLKFLVYMNHAEKEIEFERKAVVKSHENNIRLITSKIFARSDRSAFLGLKNKLELMLNIEFDPINLKFCLLRVQKEVSS